MLVAGDKNVGFGMMANEIAATVDDVVASMEGYGAQSGGPSSSGMPEESTMTGEAPEPADNPPTPVEGASMGDRLSAVPWYVWAGGAAVLAAVGAFAIGASSK